MRRQVNLLENKRGGAFPLHGLMENARFRECVRPAHHRLVRLIYPPDMVDSHPTQPCLFPVGLPLASFSSDVFISSSYEESDIRHPRDTVKS